MSAVGVALIAAVMAGAVWYERWSVRRRALRRGQARHRTRLWAAMELTPPPDRSARRLAVSIRRAVFAGDLAAAYEERWRDEAKRGESPFQLKRSRMEASAKCYTDALDTVETTATAWLDGDEAPRQLNRAIERLTEYLGARPRDGALSDLASLDTTIDILESALANLCSNRPARADPHPFRG